MENPPPLTPRPTKNSTEKGGAAHVTTFRYIFPTSWKWLPLGQKIVQNDRSQSNTSHYGNRSSLDQVKQSRLGTRSYIIAHEWSAAYLSKTKWRQKLAVFSLIWAGPFTSKMRWCLEQFKLLKGNCSKILLNLLADRYRWKWVQYLSWYSYDLEPVKLFSDLTILIVCHDTFISRYWALRTSILGVAVYTGHLLLLWV